MKRYAIFFPQYYRIDVNDLAWGYGFTDWALIAAANAFSYWPRRSPACGFYDLSQDDHISARFEFASGAGLDGFAIYHYRFDDGPELDAVERYLWRTGTPEGFKYFYIWANENWSTRWVGGKIRLLKELSASPDRSAVAQHVDYLAPFMKSASYTKVGGRPLFVFYRPDHFSEIDASLALYRDEFKRRGLDPLLGFFVKNVNDLRYSRIFDFCYLFEPRLFFNFQGVRKNPAAMQAYRMLARMFSFRTVESTSEVVTRLLNKRSATYTFANFLKYLSSDARHRFVDSFQCPVQDILTCGWNNAPRYRKRFTKLDTPSVEQFSSMMSVVSTFSASRSEAPLLCNAWNEWAEGAAIEPCYYLGDTLLKSYLTKERSLTDERKRET
jgi:Glycosyltransferase WbsX